MTWKDGLAEGDEERLKALLGVMPPAPGALADCEPEVAIVSNGNRDFRFAREGAEVARLNLQYEIYKDEPCLVIHEVFVQPEVRGCGCGGWLVDLAKMFDQHFGPGRIVGIVKPFDPDGPDRDALMRFYDRRGFRTIGMQGDDPVIRWDRPRMSSGLADG
jgi:GNAT superfamily N-acetyltransferase